MSLINDALKKAQRERAGQSGPLPSMSGGVGRRGMSTQTMVLIGIGALVLVSLSVVFTVFLTSSPAQVPTKAVPLALSQQKMGTAPAAANAAPTIVFSTADKAPPAAAATSPATASGTTAPLAATAPSSTPPAAVASSATFSKTTDEIQDMVDKFRVAGVRSSATGSKVLMNDHIVKLNELVDRETGLRLIKIEDSSLTFQDGKGEQYTKSF